MLKIIEWVTNRMPFAPEETKVVLIDNYQALNSFDDAEIKTFTNYNESLAYVKNKIKDHLTKDLHTLIDLADLLMHDSGEDYRSTQPRLEALARLKEAKRWLKEDNPKLADIMDSCIKMKIYFDRLTPSMDHARYQEFQQLNETIFNTAYGWFNIF